MASPYEIDEIFPDTVAAFGRPAGQAGNTAQGLTTTLVTDYTVHTRAWLPSAAIVALVGELGVTSGGARTAISRLSRRGVLDSRRQGRHSAYRLTRGAAEDLSAGGAWIARFGTDVHPWDGCWTLVAFSLPQEENLQRRALRGQLRWLGFAPLYDGLWVSPDALNQTVKSRLPGISVGAMTVFRANHVELATGSNRNPIDAWDIAALADHYENFIQRWKPLLAPIRNGRISGAAAVRARTEIMDSYRRIPLLDPHLPVELMPAGWPRARAQEIFVAVYDGLAEQAEKHVRAVVARYGGHPHTEIRAHTVAELTAGTGAG
jgi:phenylacetic acid degradation operon negative regulatory protein